MLQAEKGLLPPEQMLVDEEGNLERVDFPERGVSFFWRKFEREVRKLRDEGDPGFASPESLNRTLWTTYYDFFQESKYFAWANEIREQWKQNFAPPHGHLVDVLEFKAGNHPLSAFLPTSICVERGPYATYALVINRDFGKNGILRFGDLIALDIIPFPLTGSARPKFAQSSPAILEGEIARLPAFSPPFVFNLQNLEEIDKRQLQEAIAGLLRLMIEVGWADRLIDKLVLKGTIPKIHDNGYGRTWDEQVPVAETIDTGGQPLYAGLLRTGGRSYSGSLRGAILNGYPFSSTKANWPDRLKNPRLFVYAGRERSFGVDDIGSASEFHRFVSSLHSGAILNSLREGSGCVSDFDASQRAMDMPGELASLQIAIALSTGLKINGWRIENSRYRSLVKAIGH